MTQPPGPGYLPPAVPSAPPASAPAMPPAVAPPPPDAQWRPARVDPVAGTEFGLVQIEIAPVRSGLATGSLIAGIGSLVVSVLVLCFGVAGASSGWGGWVSGAFALLAVLFGGGAVALGLVAVRQIRRSGHDGRVHFTGRGVAIAGISCGGAGVGIALLALALGLLLRLS